MPTFPQKAGESAGITRRALLIIVGGMLLAGGTPPLVLGRWRADGQAVPEPPSVVSLELGEFLVNLADTDQPRYLKTEIILEVSGLQDKAGHGASDGVDANDLMGEEGKDLLRQELARRINDELPQITVHEVLFSSFVMQ
ncbi:MAG: flagellar basal body-associated protein FliL [Armatimonadota bacterium]